MAQTTTKAKSSQKASSSAQVTQHAIKKADIGKLVKAIMLGPLVVGIVVSAAYAGLWGISKAFVAVHSLVLAKVWPWVTTNWWIIGLIWLIIAGSCCWFYAKDFAKTQKKAAKKAVIQKEKDVEEKKKNKEGEMSAIMHSEQSIFSTPIAKKDEFNYEAEMERVLGHSYAPSPTFSAESIFGKVEKSPENGENKEPYTFISMGPSEEK